MTARAGLLRSASRPAKRVWAIRGLWGIALVCVLLWAQGLFQALTAGAGAQAGAVGPTTWVTRAAAIRNNPFRALPLLVGPARAHRVESWALASFPLALIAEGAVILSLYLRRTR